MTMLTEVEAPDGESDASVSTPPPDAAGAPIDLLACLRALDGWVRPEGLAARERFEALAAAGLLEAWPGGPYFRA